MRVGNQPKRARVGAREKLLDAAFVLIREKGYSATSVDELCAAAGVTKGAFFHHFQSKTALAVAAANRWSEVSTTFFQAAPYHEHRDPLDAVTAISGSGPAYIFALTEALAAAAERLGLPAELSMSLARGTVEGAAELMRRESATPPATLRRNVTSPGGTTAAALAVLQAPEGLNDLMARATAAACARAAEMAG